MPQNSISSLKKNPFKVLPEENFYNELNESSITDIYNRIDSYSKDGEKTLLFIDDMIPKHEDFDKFLEDTTNYINITPYYSEITDNELDAIWDIFEKIFTELLEKHKIEISDVVHIKKYLKANNLEELKNKYLEYSRERTPTVPYTPEDKIDVAIKTQIKPYILHLSKHRGGRIKKRTRKIKHRYTKRMRNYTEDSE
jgi:hypothetical protein